MSRILFFSLLASAILQAPVAAQETTATLGAGGLALARTASVEVEKQSLTIALGRITTDYVFKNGAETAATFLVTFPMPEIDGGDLIEAPARYPKNDPVNFLDFRILVDGKPIAPRIEQRAFGLGIDMTDVLKADKIPLNPSAADAVRALGLLSAARKAEYTKRGLALFESAESVFPLWSVTTIAFWEQTFPAGRSVAVQIAYAPIAGQFSIAKDAKKDDSPFEDYCLQDEDWTPIERLLSGGAESVAAFDVQYVLTAGASWMGPIKEFELTIEKPDAEAAVSLCLEGVTNAARLISFKAADFVPEQDLRILFVPGKSR